MDAQSDQHIIPSPVSPAHRPRRPTRSIPDVPTTTTTTTVTSDLTPIRAHYLKKSLIQLQFSYELDAITTSSPSNVSTLSFLGSPFSPPPRNADPFLDLPLLRYIFRQFVLTFPFMAAAPKDFYSDKLQPFAASVLARNLSPTSVLDQDDDGDGTSEQATRKKLLAKVERNLAMFVGAATKLIEREEVVRLNQADLDRLEALSRKRRARSHKPKDIFEVNVIGVKTVVDKGRMRSRAHDEFIVRTRRSHFSDVFVSRRYGDFKTLAVELQRVHPDEQIRAPPPKDRTVVSAPLSPQPPSLAERQQSSWESGAQPYMSDPSPSQQSLAPSRLAREKNRLTLRSYLHALLASSTIASSPVLRSFLLSSPITLSHEELEDAQRREEADNVREDGRRRFASEVAARVEGLRGAMKSVKGDIMGKDGLTHVFATIKVTPDVRMLPENYQAVLEWARISLASTVFQHFVASDNSSETFASLKRLHGLMPYFMLKTVLKVSNPISMIRGVLDLFLAQPFGGRSLLQRMFTSSLSEEVKALEADIEAVKDKVDDPMMCAKVKQFVYAPREIQDMYKVDAAAEHMNLLIVVLRSPDDPVLSRGQIHRLSKAHRAHSIYLRHRATLEDSDDDDGPQDDDAWLMEDLKVLTHLYSRLRDREQLIALIFEGFTADLLKDIITIFYTPLAQVYRAASIADSLNDLQNFINDLIRTVEQVEELSQVDPHRTVTAFIDLIQRHEQSFYHFVHKVHSKGENLFDSLMRWIELFLTVVREGLGTPLSLEFLLPHTGKERADILNEVDKVALYHYKLKVVYEDKIRRRFGRMQNSADAADEAAQVLVSGVVGEIDFGELVQGDADDLAAEQTDEESEDEESSEYETSSEEDSDDESSGESGEESEGNNDEEERRESAGKPSHPTVVRSQTTRAFSPNPTADSTPPIPRQRSLSLRGSRSMNFSLNNISLTRRSHDIPPVPSLPMSSKSTNMGWEKPLPPPPPSPNGRSLDDRLPLTPSKLGHEPLKSPQRNPPQHKSKPKPKKSGALKPPELQHIPQLLPVFVEMMRPLLRPRQRTEATTVPT
ncbi:hypothetical protein BDZ94DRAFT_1260957 [Collybia nuda]|uniref:PX domain-containing protein n=1 Tax=Collybia nuda TaxID=64659 RepID=A0A9P6CHU7_9AGAR|nr:hypothetical protein BDZ94DRAFT_1260957 [Collybia nuda]